MWIFFITLVLISLMIPNWNHMSKLDYMEKQGYFKTYDFTNFEKYSEIIYIKGNVRVTESELKLLSLDEIKEKY